MKYLCCLVTYLSVSSAASSLGAIEDHRRIVGGDEADIKNIPYMGSLLFYRQHNCGVVLIRNDTVVTAAHCVKGFHITGLSVRLGSSQWRSGGQEISVKQVISHPKYPTSRPDYDIAVIKLNESVNVANAVPIGLAAQDRQYETGTPGVASGWGRTCLGAGGRTETLRKVEVPVYDQTECEHAYVEGTVTNRMICAGYKQGGKGVYKGDSGGPYVINGELVGIASFVADCAKSGRPDVYASVPALHKWIELHA